MISQNSNIDRIFRDGLADFEITPPPEVWEEVHNRIQSRSRKLPLFYRVAAASVLLFILSGSAWLLFFNQPDKQGIAEMASAVKDENILPPPGIADETELEKPVVPTIEDPRSVSTQSVVETGQLAALSQTDREIAEVESLITPVTDENRGANPQYQLTQEAIQAADLPRLIDLRSNTNLDIYHPVTLLTLSARDLSQESMTPLPVENMPGLLKEKIPKWAVGGQFSPVYSFRYIGRNSLSTYRDSYNSQENGMVAYTGGLHIQYNSNRKLSIHTGIYFSRMGQQVGDIQLFKTANNEPLNLPIKGNLNINNSIGSISSENQILFFQDESGYRVEPFSLSESYDPLKEGLIPIDATIVQSLEYLEIPLIIRYKLIDRKVDFNILGGLSTNFMVGNEAYANYNGTKIHIGETNGLRTINYSSTLGIGLEYNLSDHVSFSLEPAFKFYLNSINQDENINTHPYSIGIFTGLSYIFK